MTYARPFSAPFRSLPPAAFERLGDWPSMSPDAKARYVRDLKRSAAAAKARFGLYNFRPI